MSNKKQTAVEWLESQLFFLGNMILNQREILNQAKEMEKQQKDDYAIEFGEYLRINYYETINNCWVSWDNDKDPKTSEEILKIFKKEKGL